MTQQITQQMHMLEPLLDELVQKHHPYRKFLALLDFDKLCLPLKDVGSDLGRAGYDIRQGFAALLLQWIEDLSNRQMERFLQENNAGKSFRDGLLLQQLALISGAAGITAYGTMLDVATIQFTGVMFALSNGMNITNLVKQPISEATHAKLEALRTIGR